MSRADESSPVTEVLYSPLLVCLLVSCRELTFIYSEPFIISECVAQTKASLNKLLMLHVQVEVIIYIIIIPCNTSQCPFYNLMKVHEQLNESLNIEFYYIFSLVKNMINFIV